MISQTKNFCGLYKVGLMAGKKYDKTHLVFLLSELTKFAMSGAKIYVKDSVLSALKISREELPKCFAGKDFKLF